MLTEQSPTVPGANRFSRPRLLLIFGGLLLGILMAVLDGTIVATALQPIATDLNGLREISWIVTVYLLTQTICMPLYGKLGDFIGRKRAFQLAIVIFLVGSVLSGIAGSMGTLIAFRAVQGIGAGGLLVGAQTIMAEIVTPRERAKYMSVMGPMIGFGTVLGPLIGGYLTQYASWRWVFYVNVPVGIIAFIIIGAALTLPHSGRRPRIDYAGAVTLAGAVTCLVLLLNWGGSRYAWGSPTVLGLAVGVAVLTPLFVLAERRAAEPLIPLHLFRDSVFRVNVPLAAILGVAMFGAISFMPTFLQMSLRVSTANSGLLLLPLMGGLMVAAVTIGQLMSRTGRYKIFPLIGTPVAGLGLYLLSLMDADTSLLRASLSMLVLGVGIGLVMPMLVLAVQNSVAEQDVGTATAGVNFFRQIGASLGVALIGSLFTSRLVDQLSQRLPAGADLGPGGAARGVTPEILDQLPAPIARDFVVSYATALTPLFAYVAPLLLLAFVITWFLKEKPLTTAFGEGAEHDTTSTNGHRPRGETGRPSDPDRVASVDR